MTPLAALAVGLEAAVGVLLLLYASFLASNRRDRSAASLLLAALCAAIAVTMGSNLMVQTLGWPVFTDISLFVDLLAPALVLGLVRQARSPPPRLGPVAWLNVLPAAAGLAAWKASRIAAMDPYVIGCWAAYLGWAAWSFARHRAAYGSAATRRLLIAVLGFSTAVLGLRVLLALQASAQGSFLHSTAYLAVLSICLAAACLILFAALSSGPGRSGLFARYAAGPGREAELESLEARLQAALAARIFLDPNLTLEGLAQALEAPPRLVSRLINARHGSNVAAFLNRRRVEVAAELLLAAPDQPIKAVMYDAGFVSKSLFNAEFQRQMGVSPSVFRQRAIRRPSSGSPSIRRA
jgi:AraC-like DNA-binding protein